MNGFNTMIVIFLSVFLLSAANARDKEQRPLKIMSSSEWAGLSEKEQGLLIMGVLEGWSFDLFNQNHPRLKLLVECVEQEGIGKFINEVNELLVSEPEEGKFPAPWWVSKSLRSVCLKYQKE
ncbi:MAG: hypothetical protein ACE5G9_05960 [Nitrospinales bacterium]